MLKVLLSGVGRRVELVNFFKQNDFYVISLDIDLTAPALYFSDKFYRNLKFSDQNFIYNIVKLVNKEKVDLAFSLIDPELPFFSKNKQILENVFKFFPDYYVVNTTYNKFLFFDYFSKLIKNNIVLSLSLEEVINNKDNDKLKKIINQVINDEFLIIKPIFGSSSNNVFKIKNIFKYFDNLFDIINYLVNFFDILGLDYKDFIIQRYINYREEITVDIFYDLNSNVVELCQRKRLKVRAGEVERAVTVKYSFLTDFVLKLSKILINNGFRLVGPVNFQFLIIDEIEFYLSEINTRFGGGYPLSYYAKANFFEHIKNILNGYELNYFVDSRYKEGIYMLRYDNSLIIENI
ncbi:MAG: ATP-grasp domain-containing protein [bacterium]|jgi:carbamoyl-phosphate synthase large subunit